MSTRQKGFTLIELLVVVAIIGLLLSITSVALAAQRQKARDTRRISDLKQIKSAMDLYYDTGAGYPDTGTWVPGTYVSCNGAIIMRVPKDPSDPVFVYGYAGTGGTTPGCGTNVRTGYTFTFFMERQDAAYTMDQEGTLRDQVSGTIVSIDSLL